MVNNKQMKLVLGVLTLVVAVIIVGLSIAILVKVYEKPDKVEVEDGCK
jgi:NADH:ubiquinone oxidoreductase subunit K